MHTLLSVYSQVMFGHPTQKLKHMAVPLQIHLFAVTCLPFTLCVGAALISLPERIKRCLKQYSTYLSINWLRRNMCGCLSKLCSYESVRPRPMSSTAHYVSSMPVRYCLHGPKGLAPATKPLGSHTPIGCLGHAGLLLSWLADMQQHCTADMQ